jgi:hypothetical protein
MLNATVNKDLAPGDPNWSARVNGLASTKGRTDRNKELGRKQAERVRDHLIEWGVETVRFRGSVGSGGETFWKSKGFADDIETGEHRAVIVAFYRVDYLTLTEAQRAALVDRALVRLEQA